MVSFCNLVNTGNRMENSEKFRPDPKPRLMDQVRQALNAIVFLYKRVLDDELSEVFAFWSKLVRVKTKLKAQGSRLKV